MGKPCKTIRLSKVVAEANKMLRDSADDKVDFRYGLQFFVSHLLMEANAYNGFSYINGYPGEDQSRIAFYSPKES